MNSLEIANILSHYKYTRGLFCGVYARDRVPVQPPRYPCCFILNTDSASKEGEHWLAIFYDQDGNAEFFDSYGQHPSQYRLESYLEQTSRGWTYNKKQLQHYFSIYCGHYCCLFLMFRCNNYTLNEFLSKFSNCQLNNDMIIKDLIKRGLF